ncbi:hypothetical protein EniLVp02_0019 [Vibrio phage EniLVp02]
MKITPLVRQINDSVDAFVKKENCQLQHRIMEQATVIARYAQTLHPDLLNALEHLPVQDRLCELAADHDIFLTNLESIVRFCRNMMIPGAKFERNGLYINTIGYDSRDIEIVVTEVSYSYPDQDPEENYDVVGLVLLPDDWDIDAIQMLEIADRHKEELLALHNGGTTKVQQERGVQAAIAAAQTWGINVDELKSLLEQK